MGRKKLQLNRITDKKKRQNTYKVRARGCFKKIMEIAILTDCSVEYEMSFGNNDELTSTFKSEEFDTRDKVKEYYYEHFPTVLEEQKKLEMIQNSTTIKSANRTPFATSKILESNQSSTCKRVLPGKNTIRSGESTKPKYENDDKEKKKRYRGRQVLPLMRISNKKQRNDTFRTRKFGILKKIVEICILTDCSAILKITPTKAFPSVCEETDKYTVEFNSEDYSSAEELLDYFNNKFPRNKAPSSPKAEKNKEDGDCTSMITAKLKKSNSNDGLEFAKKSYKRKRSSLNKTDIDFLCNNNDEEERSPKILKKYHFFGKCGHTKPEIKC